MATTGWVPDKLSDGRCEELHSDLPELKRRQHLPLPGPFLPGEEAFPLLTARRQVIFLFFPYNGLYSPFHPLSNLNDFNIYTVI